MLLIDDDDRVPGIATEEEVALAAMLGLAGQNAIDEAILNSCDRKWLKVARIIHAAIDALEHCMEEDLIQLCARRIVALVQAGKLEAQGDLYRPRFSEIRVPAQL